MSSVPYKNKSGRHCVMSRGVFKTLLKIAEDNGLSQTEMSVLVGGDPSMMANWKYRYPTGPVYCKEPLFEGVCKVLTQEGYKAPTKRYGSVRGKATKPAPYSPGKVDSTPEKKPEKKPTKVPGLKGPEPLLARINFPNGDDSAPGKLKEFAAILGIEIRYMKLEEA